MSKILEIACFDLESALIAQAAGTDRIELCVNYSVGGLTPSNELITEARKKIHIPMHVIIRPRAGDFVYSKNEIEEMKKSIQFCKSQKIDGLVFGCLNLENKVDVELCKELMDEAQSLAVTFHRAIDATENILSEIETIQSLGFSRVLTSGGKENAFEGKEILGKLEKKFNTQIRILPGGGIRSTNLNEIAGISNCNEFHSAARLNGAEICDAGEIQKLKVILNTHL